jgi:hypothetical protein
MIRSVRASTQRLEGAAGRAERGARRLAGRATSGRRVLPSIVIIGAQRAGTTSLFDALVRHPHAARPTTKEVHFFDENFWRGLDWYRSHFPLASWQKLARRRGRDAIGIDATPNYLLHPAAPSRAAATVPEARFVVLLRDPVARAYSHYQLTRRKKVERLSFREALAAEERRLAGQEERLVVDPRYRSFQHLHHSYVSRGLYADQLDRWLAHFPKDRLHVVFAEEFFARPHDVYAETIAFLGLPSWEPLDFPNQNAARYPEMDDEARAWLAERFAKPNERLSRLLGRRLPWEAAEQSGSSPPNQTAARSGEPASRASTRATASTQRMSNAAPACSNKRPSAFSALHAAQ